MCICIENLHLSETKSVSKACRNKMNFSAPKEYNTLAAQNTVRGEAVQYGSFGPNCIFNAGTLRENRGMYHLNTI